MGRIYVLICPKSNIVRYVGQTIQTLEIRLKQHLWYSVKQKNHLGYWLNSLSESPIIKEIEECSYDDLNAREIYWINFYITNKLVNSMKGCLISGHHTHSEESKRKIGEASTKRQLGRKHTEETKKRISLSLKGIAKGKKRSQETIDKIVESRKGYKTSEETKRKISNANKGRRWSTIAKVNFSKKRTKDIYVYNIELKSYKISSTEELAKYFGVNNSSINSRLNKYYGKIYRNKFIFTYSKSELVKVLKMIGYEC